MNPFQRAIVFLKYSLRSIRFIFTEEYDLVFATSTPLTAGIPGIIMKISGKKIPFIFEVRDLVPELPKEMGEIKNKFTLWALELLEYFSYNMSDACVALSPGIQKGILKKLKIHKPVFLIPNGCDLDLFTPGHISKSIISGCTDDDFIAVFIGAHGIANGLDSALDAAGVLINKNNCHHIKIVLIGDGMMKSKLLKRAEAENLKNVIFLNPVPKNQLPPYLWASDVGLMLLSNVPAFYFGTSPNKFFDYISAGLPVLNNYPGWLAEIITSNQLGLVVKPDDPEEFADALIKLSSDKDKLIQMGLNARAFSERHFDRKKLADEFEKSLVSTHEKYYNAKES